MTMSQEKRMSKKSHPGGREDRGAVRAAREGSGERAAETGDVTQALQHRETATIMRKIR